MTRRKIDFSNIEWDSSTLGVRSKAFELSGKKFRLLELQFGLEHPNWCLTGHIGYVVKGELDIIFDDETVNYTEGDAIFISSGEKERHIPKPISEKVILFLVDDLDV